MRGAQGVSWVSSDAGSGLRLERLRIDGAERQAIDYQATGQCNLAYSQTNGEFARTYSPCPTGSAGRSYALDTASLADGSHSLSACAQDYAQYRGLNGTGSESCVSRTIRVDNTAPGAPAGLHVLSANPARYLDRFGVQFSLPPDPARRSPRSTTRS